MIVISENNYKQLEKISYDKDPKNNPDIVMYKNIFTKSTIDSFNKLLESITFNKNNKIWFSDNPLLHYSNNLLAQPFPILIEKLREDIEKITGISVNCCLITRYENTDTLWYKNDKNFDKRYNNNNNSLIIPVVSFGSSRELEYQSILNSDVIKELNISSGSLLIERESVKEYWNNSLVQSDNKSDVFYNLFFYNIYMNENNNNIVSSVKAVSTKKKKRLPLQLSKIYLNSKMRSHLRKIIRNGLSSIREVSEGYQCFMKNGINELSKYIKLVKFIGSGDWGNVYSACMTKDILCRRKFAIKMSRITIDDFNDPYTDTSAAWYEIWMLKDIFKPLIKGNICPNLPLFIDTFLCNECDFSFRKGENKHPCIITIMELASGDMREYLKFGNPSDKEIYSALFQIMAGVHAIQMSGQILNNDIKAKNILCYDVDPGGYWHYRIDNYDFYVPNFGKMFILNDFGVSTLYNPNFQLYPNKKRSVFNLGSRYAINIDEIFSPIEAKVEYYNNGLIKTKEIKWLTNTDNGQQTSNGASYKIDRKTGQVIVSHTMLTPIQKSYLFRKGVITNPKTWDFFEHPDIIPPFEFYNDVQDTLRMIVGGKRTTQHGNHYLHTIISKNVIKNIKPYLGLSENANTRKFSVNTYEVLAGSFIKKFFTKTVNYTTKSNGRKISFYDMNKCKLFNKY